MKEFTGKSTDEAEQLLQSWQDQDMDNGVGPSALAPGVVPDPRERDRVICVSSSGQVCILDSYSVAVATSAPLCEPIGFLVKLLAVDPPGARISAAARTKTAGGQH